jgi:hypothetical protein
MRHLHHRPVVALILAMPVLACVAAPTTEAPAAIETQQVYPAPVGARAGAANSDTRTIDLLVEMQQPTAGIQFNERSARGAGGEQRARAAQSAPSVTQPPVQRPQVEAPLTPPSGLFGSGATPAVQARTQNISDSSSRDVAPSRAAARPSSDVPPELKRWLQWPREFIEYVRENRAAVIGGTALVLVLGWSASLMFSRRRG